VRGVCELAELRGEQVGGLLADVDRAVADALDRAGHHDHTEAPFTEGRLGHYVDQALDEPAIGAIDQLVELGEALGLREVALGERVHRDPEHLLGPLAHLDQHGDEGRVRVGARNELRKLGDRHATVGAPLEQEVDVDHREQQPQVARDRRLESEERLNRAFDREEEVVDLVVERDHLVGELDVPLLQRPVRSADRRDDALAFLLQLRFEPVESFVDRHPDTVHPRNSSLSGCATTP
jgi:hypothetical protein